MLPDPILVRGSSALPSIAEALQKQAVYCTGSLPSSHVSTSRMLDIDSQLSAHFTMPRSLAPALELLSESTMS